jgi:hypothetical protein
MFSESALTDSKVLRGIEDCIDLAPLHNPHNISGTVAMRDFLGKYVRQVAVFDSAFHHSVPEQAYLNAVPYQLCRRHRSGPAAATFITLLLVPVFYSIFVFHLKWTKWDIAEKES